MERKEHEIQVDKASLITGENTFACTFCGSPVVLVWDGERFRNTDGTMPDFSSLTIVWIGYA
jgi:hypothetical protein